jgi:FlaA1/EpsC-like NDP-sugar epimerase
MKPILLQLFALPRRTKQIVLLVSDLACFPLLFWVALALRYDSTTPPVMYGPVTGLLIAGSIGVGCLALGGVYRAVVRAFDEKFLHDLVQAVSLLVGLLFVSATFKVLPMPRSVPFIYAFFMFLWVWASRSAIRRAVHLAVEMNGPVKRVAIYGAGVAGRQILSVLRGSPDYFPVAFFDDDPGLAGARVQGMRVYAGKEFGRVHYALALDEVLIAIPSATRARRRQIIERLEPTNLRVRMLPGLDQLVGQATLSDIREVDITDLLGRDPVPPIVDLLQRNISGKRVLVTGAGGSIGAEICRQVLAQKPDLLVLWELSEFALYTIDNELRRSDHDANIVSVLGSVLHEARLKQVMKEHQIDTVYHAAAYKHVPIVEDNPFEGIFNNTLGTFRAACAASEADVSTFVLISTDKAVRPTNVMGASKRLAEMALQALAAESSTRTRFCMVRFGNVLGSSGSVVPLFREQIAKGGPVTVTHPDVTRYFMTIPEAAQLVIQAGAMSMGGDVFVLDMGESVKILDLARRMIRLSGMSVKENGINGDIEVVFSGLRPGEKLYEELLIGTDVAGTAHQRIMRATDDFISLAEFGTLLTMLLEQARCFDVSGLKLTLAKVIEGYVPDIRVSERCPPAADYTNVVPLKIGA